jgi:hypothetical protein
MHADRCCEPSCTAPRDGIRTRCHAHHEALIAWCRGVVRAMRKRGRAQRRFRVEHAAQARASTSS